MRHHRRRFLLAALIAPWLWMTPSIASETHAQLLEQMRAGGLVIYWRHAITDRSRRDQDLSDMGRCEVQRVLSDAGRAQARAMGEAFARLDIPVGEVITSPFCRNVESAQLAFGRYEVDDDLFNWPPAPAARKPQLIEALRSMLAKAPLDPHTNTVLVGHNLNMRQAAGLRIEEGEMAVFRPLKTGGFQHLGNLTDRELAALVR